MSAAFEVYEHSQRGLQAVRRGANWRTFPLPGLWFLVHGLWLPAVTLMATDVALFLLAPVIFPAMPVLFCATALAPRFISAATANRRLARRLQSQEYAFLGLMESANRTGAIRNTEISRTALLKTVPGAADSWLDRFPRAWRPALNIAQLTARSALRFRIVQLLFVVLLAIVIGLPIVLRHDGTAQGLTQIIIAYSLGSIITILGFSTLWLAVGNLAREVEDGQLQIVSTKPIPRWKILLGKWLGIMSLNLGLLTVSAVAVQILLQWRAQQLPQDQQTYLRERILTARSSLKPIVPDFDAMAEEQLAKNMNRENVSTNFDRAIVLDQIRDGIRATYEGVLPNQVQQWNIPVGLHEGALNRTNASLRVKFRTAGTKPEPVKLPTIWLIGNHNSSNHVRIEAVLTTDTFHELPVPPNLTDTEGNLDINFLNITGETVVFESADGPELLYREASFETNVVRGFAILFCWLGLAAAIGLAAASRLNFNVAAFFAMSLIVIGMFSGTISAVTELGTIWVSHDGDGTVTWFQRASDTVIVPMIRFLDFLLGAVSNYSPIESLSLGRSVTWMQTASAFFQCWIAFGSVLAAVAIHSFTRRELANPNA